MNPTAPRDCAIRTLLLSAKPLTIVAFCPGEPEYLLEGLQSVHSGGHDHVQEDQVGLSRSHRGDGCLAGVHAVDAVVQRLQDSAGDIQLMRLVVDNEDGFSIPLQLFQVGCEW